ncbi:hypothetical protein Cni_G01961 [Canna indica]|uniref:Uncharacterized protein n=1 Tax=Canna indica TaxID=4628 RepID=A0AAQ3JRB9_9LILI|nr:hypothetical protein Cni_G01961 [Canna indica]
MLEDNNSDMLPVVLKNASEEGRNWDYADYSFLNSSGNKKRPLDEESEKDEEEDDESLRKKLPQHPDTPDIEEVQHTPHNFNHHGNDMDYNDPSTFINPLGKDLTVSCLLCLSRSYYGTVASINTSFRSLIQSGQLYQLRRQEEITEYWIYFSCTPIEWEAYDPYRGLWIHVPRMPPTGSFMCSDKESLAVGTDLLVFGKEFSSHIVMRYSILTNSWSRGVVMNSPRCLFASASLGEKAIVAGGSDAMGKPLDSVELYNSETQTWQTLPSMTRARSMCSGAFMDGKFYVLGGMDQNKKVLTCGEEYDFERHSWREIPEMSNGLNGASGAAPPLVAVVNNELYAGHCADNELRKYIKGDNRWVTLGQLPERSTSLNGWGLAFRACGERLVVIGGPRVDRPHIGGIQLNYWIPNERPPEWNLLAWKQSGSFVYNCAVMGC